MNGQQPNVCWNYCVWTVIVDLKSKKKSFQVANNKRSCSICTSICYIFVKFQISEKQNKQMKTSFDNIQVLHFEIVINV